VLPFEVKAHEKRREKNVMVVGDRKRDEKGKENKSTEFLSFYFLC
jgi:hypothetical protein